MARVVVVGSLNMDLVVRVARHPRPGETLLGGSFAKFHGGKGANQAIAARRSGAEVRFVGRIGSDDHGSALRDGLASEGIDVAHVGVCTHDPTGVALITVDDAGQNTIVVASGANAKLRPEHVDDAVNSGVLRGASVMLAQLECPVATVAAALSAARAAGVTTVLNAAPAPSPADLGGDFLELVDLLVVNEHEHNTLAGAVAQAGRVAVTLGERGVRCGELRLLGHRVDAVDTTGAGDAFCGALAAALALGRSLPDALVRANAAGALACTADGAQTSLPTAAQIDALLTHPRA